MVKEKAMRIALRFPDEDQWLWEDVVASAKRSGWGLSQQVRFELAANRGRAKMPVLPSALDAEHSFSQPIHETHGQKSHRRRKTA